MSTIIEFGDPLCHVFIVTNDGLATIAHHVAIVPFFSSAINIVRHRIEVFGERKINVNDIVFIIVDENEKKK